MLGVSGFVLPTAPMPCRARVERPSATGRQRRWRWL